VKRYVPLFLLLTLVLSACTIRFDVGLVVNEDESGTFTLFVGLDDELRELMEQGGGEALDITDQLSDVPEGWTVEEVTEDGFEGVRVATDYTSFDDLNAKLGEMSEGDESGGLGGDLLSDFDIAHEGDEYRFVADVSNVDEGLTGALDDSGSEDLLGGLDPSSLLGDLFEIRFQLTLPGTINEHNADSVNGNTLTWNLDVTEEAGTLEASSTVGGSSSALLLGGAAVAAVVVVGVGVTAVRRRKESVAVGVVEDALNR
jgi:hypothetical protein